MVAREGTLRTMARENQKKRAALRKSLSAKATKISDKGQAIYRTVAKIALKVRPPASTPCSHVHVHVHVHVHAHVHAHVHVYMRMCK